MDKLATQPLRESAISTVVVIDSLDECEDEGPAIRMILPELLPASHPECPSSRVLDYIQGGPIDASGPSNTWEAITDWSHQVAEEFDPDDPGIGPTQDREVSNGECSH